MGSGQPATRQDVVEVMITDHSLSKAKACRITSLPRTALYRPRENRLQRDEPIIEALNDIIKKRPRWGFWKCFDRIRLDGHGFNHKGVHRVYCDMKLNMKRRTKKRIADRPRLPLDQSHELNRNWSLDFMRDTLYDRRAFRIFNVIDEGNRQALRIEIGTSISAIRVVRIMNELIEVCGKPDPIRLDNGPEISSHKFVEWAEDRGIALRYIQPGKPNQNAFIERFNKSYREEVLDANLFNTLAEVQAATDEWVEDYNHFRPHESLGRILPTQFMPHGKSAEITTFKL